MPLFGAHALASGGSATARRSQVYSSWGACQGSLEASVIDQAFPLNSAITGALDSLCHVDYESPTAQSYKSTSPISVREGAPQTVAESMRISYKEALS